MQRAGSTNPDAAHSPIMHNNALPLRDDIFVVPACGAGTDLALFGIKFTRDIARQGQCFRRKEREFPRPLTCPKFLDLGSKLIGLLLDAGELLVKRLAFLGLAGECAHDFKLPSVSSRVVGER